MTENYEFLANNRPSVWFVNQRMLLKCRLGTSSDVGEIQGALVLTLSLDCIGQWIGIYMQPSILYLGLICRDHSLPHQSCRVGSGSRASSDPKLHETMEKVKLNHRQITQPVLFPEKLSIGPLGFILSLHLSLIQLITLRLPRELRPKAFSLYI